MHELSICRSIVDQIEDQARVHAFEKVRAVRLEIGALAGVEIDALTFGFDVVTKGTLVEGAALDITNVPGEATCRDCGAKAAVKTRLAVCPECGGVALNVSGGDKLRIKELEVD